jgi:hypothetical protein
MFHLMLRASRRISSTCQRLRACQPGDLRRSTLFSGADKEPSILP